MASRAPEILEEEWERLHDAFYAQFAEEEKLREMTDAEMERHERDYRQWFRDHGSEELNAYLDYRVRVGDENQICDENGEYIRDERGYVIQDWSESEDGYVINNRTGELVRDMKGNLVRYPVLDERVERMYRDEEGEYGTDE